MLKKSRTTIKDIAKIANVTPTTVSMALNNRPRISKETRKKILRIAQDLSYQPDYTARSLKSKRSCTIGLIIKNIADPFYPELAKGIGETANELGYNVILCNANDDRKLAEQHINMLRNKGIDGIIFTSMLSDDPFIKPLVD